VSEKSWKMRGCSRKWEGKERETEEGGAGNWKGKRGEW